MIAGCSSLLMKTRPTIKSKTQLTLPNFIRIARFFGQESGHFLEEVLAETDSSARMDEI